MIDNNKTKNKEDDIGPHDIIAAYMGLCILGTAAGTYLGGIVGLGVSAFSPALVGYGLFKGIRKIIRK